MTAFDASLGDGDYRKLFSDPRDSYSTDATTWGSPRAVAVVNGVPLNIISYSIECNTHGASDSATIVAAGPGNPDWSLKLQAALADGSVIAQIFAGFPPSPSPDPVLDGLVNRFFGMVQTYKRTLDDSSDTWTFTLQSLAALLTAEKLTTQFGQPAGIGGTPGTAGYRTTRFVKYVADRFNLTANIQLLPGQTPGLMTAVYAARQWVGVRNVKILDLLIACAELDNANVYVDIFGVLNYVTPSSIGKRRVVSLQWGRDFKKFDGTHSPQFSKTIRVSVRSYTRKTRTGVSTRLSVNKDGTVTVKSSTRVLTSESVFGSSATFAQSTTFNADGSFSSSVSESSGSGGSANSGTTQFSGESGIETYKYAFPNLTVAQCNAKAIQLWQQLSRFEYSVEFGVPVTPDFLRSSVTGELFDISTLFRLSNLPAQAFNNDPATGSQPPIGTAQDNRYYYQRRYSEEFASSDSGEAEGWTMDFVCVNHPLPQSGENSLGGSA